MWYFLIHHLVMNVCPGLPKDLSTKEELCTLLSVAIFTGTVQHAATNNGQVLKTHTYTLREAPHRGPRDQLTVFAAVFPVWLVCLGSQHPVHNETTPTQRQRYKHGGDHGHPSWYQPVLYADGYHMASWPSTTWCSEYTPFLVIWYKVTQLHYLI